MKKLLLVICVQMVLLLLSSCIRDAKLKVPSVKKLVVYATVSPDDSITDVYVGHSKPVNRIFNAATSADTAYAHAIVTLSNGSKHVVLAFDQQRNTYSVARRDFPIEAGMSYHLEVTDPREGMKVKAHTTVPLSKPEGLDHKSDSISNVEQDLRKAYFIKMSWGDVGAERNYYAYDMVNSMGEYSILQRRSHILSDEKIKDGRIETEYQELSLQYHSLKSAVDRGYINMYAYHIDKNLYDYLVYVGFEDEGISITQDPVTLFTNIEGGLGVFGSYRKTSEVIKNLK
ncbi:MAG TPA: DUF4249 domain-containing protein [Cytophagales bacterium]|nr:DUF4249 domain-containing protein [Cytophagales bacterium]